MGAGGEGDSCFAAWRSQCLPDASVVSCVSLVRIYSVRRYGLGHRVLEGMGVCVDGMVLARSFSFTECQPYATLY